MKNYEKEFPHFRGVEMPIFEGFEDTSWHNDACPSFEKYLEQNFSLRVWVDHPDVKQREDGGILKARFALDLMLNCECIETIIFTDDVDELRLEIEKF